MIRSALVIIAGLLIGFSSQAEPRACVHDQRDAACVIGFSDLWGEKASYRGRDINVTGYLVHIQGRLLLYPSKDFFRFQYGRGGIWVLADDGAYNQALARMVELKGEGHQGFESPCPVWVQGQYSDTSRGDEATLGSISVGESGLAISSPVEPCAIPLPLGR